MIDRRTFLAGTGAVLLAVPPAVEAQAVQKVYRIGMLERTSQAINAANLDGLRRGLRELGYVEGKNFVIDYRSADGRDERFPALATELVRLKVDLIVARGTPAILAAKNATSTIPVISVGGLIIESTPFTNRHERHIVDLTVRHRMVAIHSLKRFAMAGGFMAYGVDFNEIYRRTAVFVDKILRGAQPPDLPIEQPTKFILVVNLKTAKALGLTIPPSLLARADQVIE